MEQDVALNMLQMNPAHIAALELAIHNEDVRAFAGGLVARELAEAMTDWFIAAGGINYIEFTLAGPHLQEAGIGDVVFTVQRRDGLTPHECRQKAEEQIKKMTDGVQVVLKKLTSPMFEDVACLMVLWNLVYNLHTQGECFLKGEEAPRVKRHGNPPHMWTK